MLEWKKPNKCTSATNCIEICEGSDYLYLRSSLSPNNIIYLLPSEWDSFITDVKAGAYDKEKHDLGEDGKSHSLFNCKHSDCVRDAVLAKEEVNGN